MANILIGVDRTAEGRSALEAGIEEAARRDARVVLLHHVKIGPEEQDKTLELRGKGERLLTRASELAEAAGIEHEQSLSLGTASAATMLLRKADEIDAELIVVGTRKRSRVGKALMGSDAQQVILGASCQVLAVKDLVGRNPLDTAE